MKLIFARHGETEAGSRHCFVGVSDSPLTEKGEQQASLLGDLFQKEKVTLLYCSPLRRAQKTVEIIVEKIQFVPILIDDLREISYGAWEGKEKELCKQLPIWNIRMNNLFTFVHPGMFRGIPGESYEIQYNRLQPFFKSLLERNETIAIIAHIGVLRSAKMFFEQSSEEVFPDYSPSNNEVFIVEKQANTYKTYSKILSK